MQNILDNPLTNVRAMKRAQTQLKLRTALEIASAPVHESWLLRPYVERKAQILMYGDAGTFKSFLALHWAMEIARTGESVLLMSAEGRGLWKRLRAWCMFHVPGKPWQETLADLPLVAAEYPLNLSDAETLLSVQGAIDRAGLIPSLVEVDTLARYSDGRAEATNEDATAYLNQLSEAFTTKYDASILLVHHTGHMEKKRARGAYSLTGNTDANFLLERPDVTKKVVSVTSGRMKDCEPPPPFEIEAHVVEIDELDQDGQPESSLALTYTGNAPHFANKRPTGKAQKALLAELERLVSLPGCVGVWTDGELRDLCRNLGFHKSTSRDAVLGLKQMSCLVPTIGGARLNHTPI